LSVQKGPSPFQIYQDLIFDLCQSTLNDLQQSQQVFDSILKTLQKTKTSDRFQIHERSWVFQIACQHILSVHEKLDTQLSCSNQIEMDALASSASRLKHFSAFFQRLQPEDRLLLLMREKYGLPFSEIASTFNLSEESLKSRRDRALRSLEKWIWSNK